MLSFPSSDSHSVTRTPGATVSTTAKAVLPSVAAAAPAFYIRFEPGGKSVVGGGVWQPGSAELGKIRDAIVASPGAWKKATACDFNL